MRRNKSENNKKCVRMRTQTHTHNILIKLHAISIEDRSRNKPFAYSEKKALISDKKILTKIEYLSNLSDAICDFFHSFKNNRMYTS